VPDITIEEAVRNNCEAIMAGDIMRVLTDFLPAAMASLMAVAPEMTQLPALTGYEIASHDVAGADHLFRIRFQTAEAELVAKPTWREVDGFWKIASIAIDGM